MWIYFDGCKTLEDVRTRFRELAKRHHPDLGGDLRIMQEINAEYQRITTYLGSNSTSGSSTGESGWDWTVEDRIRAAIYEAVNLAGRVQVEIIGTWIWVSGDTRPHAARLKDSGFRWSAKNRKWYFTTTPMRRRYRGKTMSMDWKRNRYGSHVLREA